MPPIVAAAPLGGAAGTSASSGAGTTSGKPLLTLATTGEQEALRKFMTKPIVKVRGIRIS